MYKKWVAFFSQTGSEIVEISKGIGRWPDYVVTNRTYLEGVNSQLLNRIEVTPPEQDRVSLVHIPKWPKEVDYMNIADYMGYSLLNEKWKEDVLVTLHGYLRILPANFCDKTRIFNGHPGLITEHPELKGFNPQEKVFNSKLRYEKVGCVIHRVIPELDSGEVVAVSEVDNCFKSLEQLIGGLHGLSIQLWKEFLQDKL